MEEIKMVNDELERLKTEHKKVRRKTSMLKVTRSVLYCVKLVTCVCLAGG